MSPRRVLVTLRRLREDRGLTQLQLARKAEVAQGYISALEAGTRRNPGIAVLRRLARALGVPITALFG